LATALCLETGAGIRIFLDLKNNSYMRGEWISWEEDESYKVIVVRFYQRGIYGFSIRIDETKTKK